MRWFRKNGAWGSRLALFALAVQFCLAFSHVHLDDALVAAGHKVIATTVAYGDGQQPAASDDGVCAICVTAQLTGNSVPSEGPMLPLPQQIGATALVVVVVSRTEPAPRHPFQARGPPTV